MLLNLQRTTSANAMFWNSLGRAPWRKQKKTSGKKTKKSYFLGTLWGGLDGENLKKTKKGKNIKTYKNPKKHIF